MSETLTAVIIAVCLCGAVLIGMLFRRLLPEHHLSSDTKDAVKVAMGLVATMSALLLGLLVSSAKSSYDTVRSDIIQMAAKISFLDRVLELYGPEAAPLRAGLKRTVGKIAEQLWSEAQSTAAPDLRAGNEFYIAMQGLSPRDDLQRTLKDQAVHLAVEMAQTRTLLRAQSLAAISRPLLIVVVCWLVIIFYSFTLFAPANSTATLSLLVAALSVAGAIFLILAMNHPFTGVMRISNEPLTSALGGG
jgi:hypothetical protein